MANLPVFLEIFSRACGASVGSRGENLDLLKHNFVIDGYSDQTTSHERFCNCMLSLKFNMIALGVKGLLRQAGFPHKIYHIKKFWLMPKETSSKQLTFPIQNVELK